MLNKREEVLDEIIIVQKIEDLPFNSKEIVDVVNLNIEKSNKYAYLDADKLQFPLTLRTWKNGDCFQPLGMKGNKKVSDFLIDKKISILDKQYIKVLEVNGQIIWLVGHRIDDKFKITSQTQKALILSI